jgi:hypothetical protein
MAKAPSKRSSATERPPVATRGELNKFLDELVALKERVKQKGVTRQREVVRTYLQGFGRQKLQRLLGRAFADALKSPSQKLGAAKPPSAAKTKRNNKGKKGRRNKGSRPGGRRRTTR